MVCFARCFWTFVSVFAVLTWTGATADGKGTGPDEGKKQEAKGWFIEAGATNYHFGLEDSEERIDRQLNRPGRFLFPRWKRPETFGDWSDEWKLWDLWLCAGREIGEKGSWFIGAGGMVPTTIKNTRTYFPAGVPLKLKADFTRAGAFIFGGISYYPWGKPLAEEQDNESGSRPTKGRFRRALFGMKPYAELGGGYSYVRAKCEVSLSLPVLGSSIHSEKEREEYHLFQISPRIGATCPIPTYTTYHTIERLDNSSLNHKLQRTEASYMEAQNP